MDPNHPSEPEEPFWEELEEEPPSSAPTYFVADQIVGFFTMLTSFCGIFLVIGSYKQLADRAGQDRMFFDSINQIWETGPMKDVGIAVPIREPDSSSLGLVIGLMAALLAANMIVGWGIYKSRRWAFGTSLAIGCLSLLFSATRPDPSAFGLVLTAMFTFYSFLRITNAIGPTPKAPPAA